MKQKIGTAVGFIGSAALVALLVGIHFVFRYNLYSLFGMAALFLEISSFICTGMFVGLTALQYFSASPRAFMIAKYAVGIVFLALAALGSQLCYGDLTPLFCIALAALVVCCVAESVCSHGGVPVRPRKGVGAAVLAAVVLFAGAAVLAGVHGPMKYAAALEAHQKTVEAETPSVENYCELLAGMPEDTVLKVTVSGDGRGASVHAGKLRRRSVRLPLGGRRPHRDRRQRPLFQPDRISLCGLSRMRVGQGAQRKDDVLCGGRVGVFAFARRMTDGGR